MISNCFRTGFTYLILIMSASTWANTASIQLEGDTAAGAVNPIAVQAISGETEGNKFLSFTANIFDTIEDNISATVNDVSAPFEEWSYNGGIGILPNSCESGYSANSGLCAQACPACFDSVAGVCWQQCHAG